MNYNSYDFYQNTAGVMGLEPTPQTYDLSQYFDGPHWVHIDAWVPTPEELIFVTVKNSIILPTISEFYKLDPNDPNTLNLNSFIVTTKRCYNSPEVRGHICHYLNYFERYYDSEHELVMHYTRFKTLIDFGIRTNDGGVYPYTLDNFVDDIRRYILSDRMYAKVNAMNEHNYKLHLSYRNKSNNALQYNDYHGKIFMEISFFMNVLIPLMSHYIYRAKITNPEEIDKIIMGIFDILFQKHQDVDLQAKLYETAYTTVQRDQKSNKDLWDKSEIRGMDSTVNSLDAVNTLILQVMPKYEYNRNMIMYNFTSIRKSAIKYAVDIAYEFDFVSLSSSKRDGEDSTSQFDKYEATQIKTDESKYLQNAFNANYVMNQIEQCYGPFDSKEIAFYQKELMRGGKPILNQFQMPLVLNFASHFFGDTMAPKTINAQQYIELMICIKRILESNNMLILPCILAGRVNKLVTRSLNKKQNMNLESSECWQKIIYKYRDPREHQLILTQLSILLNSDFEIIEYDPVTGGPGPNNGKKIPIDATTGQRLIEEYLLYCLLI